MWKAAPVVATIDVQDEEEHVVISADDKAITLSEEQIGSLFQDTSSGDEGDDEWIPTLFSDITGQTIFPSIV